MTSIQSPVSMQVAKKVFSMFLRTRCDRELFLSLHPGKVITAEGLPEPLKRPGIGALSVAGREFEAARNDQLVRLWKTRAIYRLGKDRYEDVDLASALRSLAEAPSLIIQGRFGVGSHKDQVLQHIGLASADLGHVPALAEFIPDILLIRRARADDQSVEVDGSRKPVKADSDPRWAIDIFDVKHTSEANPSYCGEIALYALMLANWLNLTPELRDRFYVSSRAYLWTRSQQGNSQLEQLDTAGGAPFEQLEEALIHDSEDANLRYYLATVRTFFEDVARVVKVGTVAPNGWTQLDWHVNSTCASCDWLGDKRHLSQAQRDCVDKNPAHYCAPTARTSGHLSLVPGISRGARKVLENHAVPTAQVLATAQGHPALQKHTLLKRDSKTLPLRSSAILSGALSHAPDGAISSLVKSANVLLYASVNFDSSAGMLSGLALTGNVSTYVRGQSPYRLASTAYVVDQKTLDAEWIALQGFLSQIADSMETALRKGIAAPSGQIAFWEKRQFEELCNAMGRHLPKIMAMADRKVKALAWVFPPDELLATVESVESSTIAIVEDVVRRLVFPPTAHVLTLLDTAEHYNTGFFRGLRDPYYREYLSNAIPRERIYEIWSGASQLRRGTQILPRSTVITQFSNALTNQADGLRAVCERLRKDFENSFRAQASKIPTSIPQGATGVAFDSKLWLWWDNLDFHVAQLEAHHRLSLEGERLEADYEAIIMTQGRPVGPNTFEFTIAQGSTEAKFKEDSLLTLGKLGRPGMPLERVSHLIPPGAPPFPGTSLYQPLWSALKAQLLHFDRATATARVSLSNPNDPQMVPYLLQHGSVDLLKDVFLLEAKRPQAFNWSDSVRPILTEIGNPPIAQPDGNAARVMGISPKSNRGGNAPVTPAARVLWDAASLEKKTLLTTVQAKGIADYAANHVALNDSQKDAIGHGVARRLTIIWGPPGTGKTKTLASLLHGLTHAADSSGQDLKILVTGPTYKAVEEVMTRVAALLSADPASPARMDMVYSRSRQPAPVPASLASHVQYSSMRIEPTDAAFMACMQVLGNATGVQIIGCQIRQARHFPKKLFNASVQGVFDLVIIDEASQVPVSHALSALAGLKEHARLIVAGDHLQMPPITAVEPPDQADYMIGSIQTYLLTRDFGSPMPVCVLTENYRSSEDIVAFARSIGYPATLQAAYPHTALRLLKPIPDQAQYPADLPWSDAFPDLLSPDRHVLTLLHDDQLSSQANPFEARTVAGLVWMLRQVVSAELDGRGATTHALAGPEQFWSRCVGIVTPHRAQRALIVRELTQLFPGEDQWIDGAVDTVERFQGGERHTILVTFGIADTDVIAGEEAFLMQLERTNVAISRAMAKCIVVMPTTLAEHIPEDKDALETAVALKGYVDEFCNVGMATTIADQHEIRSAQLRFHA